MNGIVIFIVAAIAALAFAWWISRNRRLRKAIAESNQELRTRAAQQETGSAIELKESELVPVEARPKRSSLPPPLPESTSTGQLSVEQHAREVSRLRKGLGNTREGFVQRMRAAFA